MLQLLQQKSGVESHETNFTTDLFVRLAAGGLAGVTAASVTYPLDLVRTRLSAQVRIFQHALCLHIYDPSKPVYLFFNMYSSFGLADKCKLL